MNQPQESAESTPSLAVVEGQDSDVGVQQRKEVATGKFLTNRAADASDDVGKSPSAFSAVRWTLICNVINLVARVACLFVLSRFLERADFGNYSIGQSVIQMLDLLVFFGLGPSLIQLTDVGKRHFQTAAALALTMAVIAVAIAVSTSGLLSTAFQSETLVWILPALSMGLAVKALSVPNYYGLMRSMRFREIALIEVTAYGLGYAATAVTLALCGFGVTAMVAGYVAQQTLLTILLLVVAGGMYLPRFHKSALQETLGFNVGIWVTRLMNFSARNGDYLVLGVVADPGIVGIYSRAYALMQILVTTVVDALEKVSFPALAKVKKNRELQGSVLESSWDVTALAYIPVGCMAALMAEEIVQVALGSKWSDVVPVFAVFAACMVLRAGYKTAGSVIRSQGRAFLLSGCQAIYAVLVLVGAGAGYQFGLIGSAVGVSLAMAVNYLLMNAVAARLLEIPVYRAWRSLALAVPFALPSVLAAMVAHWMNLSWALGTLVVAGLIWGTLMGGMLFVTGRYRVFLELRRVLRSV